MPYTPYKIFEIEVHLGEQDGILEESDHGNLSSVSADDRKIIS